MITRAQARRAYRALGLPQITIDDLDWIASRSSVEAAYRCASPEALRILWGQMPPRTLRAGVVRAVDIGADMNGAIVVYRSQILEGLHVHNERVSAWVYAVRSGDLSQVYQLLRDICDLHGRVATPDRVIPWRVMERELLRLAQPAQR